MSVTVQFLGAAETVTGSKYLVRTPAGAILVDAGMFQGERRWREENWATPEFDLREIKAVLLTHAHIDHTGILPRYRALGLHCPVYATGSTVALTKLLLADAGRLQEEEAEYRTGSDKRSRHHPPRPLYTEAQALDACTLLREVPFHTSVEILPGIKATWRRMGHILGAGSIELAVAGKRIVFSGDIGRYAVPILKDPEPVPFGDLLLIESTYGDSLHGDGDPLQELESTIRDGVSRGGAIIVPSFAVGRTQLLLYYLRTLKEQKRIADIPIIVDSPMSMNATELYKTHREDYDEEALQIATQGREPFTPSKSYFIRDRQESMKLNTIHEPMIIISASGMLSGGRILHHLKHRISSPQNTILFVGHQPKGGRGDWILRGNPTLNLFGEEVAIKARCVSMSGLSAHADKRELLTWCRAGSGVPGKVVVVHGELEVAKKFSETLTQELSWSSQVARYKGSITV
jgi:metallo-beta-lactamase family protein